MKLHYLHNNSFDIYTGSTVPYVVERIVQQGVELNKDRVFIPTGWFSVLFFILPGPQRHLNADLSFTHRCLQVSSPSS